MLDTTSTHGYRRNLQSANSDYGKNHQRCSGSEINARFRKTALLVTDEKAGKLFAVGMLTEEHIVSGIVANESSGRFTPLPMPNLMTKTQCLTCS